MGWYVCLEVCEANINVIEVFNKDGVNCKKMSRLVGAEQLKLFLTFSLQLDLINP